VCAVLIVNGPDATVCVAILAEGQINQIVMTTRLLFWELDGRWSSVTVAADPDLLNCENPEARKRGMNALPRSHRGK